MITFKNIYIYIFNGFLFLIALNTICSFHINYKQHQNDSPSLFIDEDQLYFLVRRQRNRNNLVTSAKTFICFSFFFDWTLDWDWIGYFQGNISLMKGLKYGTYKVTRKNRAEKPVRN